MKMRKKPLFPKAFLKHIIADDYFVSNRNEGQILEVDRDIIADDYFVSNRNNRRDVSSDSFGNGDLLSF